MRLWQAKDRRIVSLSCSDCASHIFRCSTVCFCRAKIETIPTLMSEDEASFPIGLRTVHILRGFQRWRG
jgi:hypothetical protein